jgi:hypothetical protein
MLLDIPWNKPELLGDFAIRAKPEAPSIFGGKKCGTKLATSRLMMVCRAAGKPVPLIGPLAVLQVPNKCRVGFCSEGSFAGGGG